MHGQFIFFIAISPRQDHSCTHLIKVPVHWWHKQNEFDPSNILMNYKETIFLTDYETKMLFIGSYLGRRIFLNAKSSCLSEDNNLFSGKVHLIYLRRTMLWQNRVDFCAKGYCRVCLSNQSGNCSFCDLLRAVHLLNFFDDWFLSSNEFWARLKTFAEFAEITCVGVTRILQSVHGHWLLSYHNLGAF